LLKKLGVKVETITAGKNKNMLNINSPLTDEQRAVMQSIADEAYEQFTAIVAKSRDMKIGEVKKLADGRIYTASQAKKNGLVDEIGTWEDALSSLRKELDDDESVVTTYRYEKKDSLLEMLSEAASKAGKTDALIPDAIRSELMLGISYPAYIYRK
ncbi:MAG: S49 family peptidase, partial [Treponema socranskii subsp. buccale]